MGLFEVTDAGLYGQGIYYPWSDLGGIWITDDQVVLCGDKYLAGCLCYTLGSLSIRCASGLEVKKQDG